MKMLWLTPKGETAMQIRQEVSGSYSYNGKYGAGSGHSKEHMEETINIMKICHPKVRPA